MWPSFLKMDRPSHDGGGLGRSRMYKEKYQEIETIGETTMNNERGRSRGVGFTKWIPNMSASNGKRWLVPGLPVENDHTSLNRGIRAPFLFGTL